MKLVIKSTLMLLLTQIILFIIPTFIDNVLINNISFSLNVIVTWLIIKSVEKKYYKNYDKYWSMLYMLCPLIGIILITTIFQLIGIDSAILTYYTALIISVYFANIIYIFIRKIRV